jgi:hypothetical protein
MLVRGELSPQRPKGRELSTGSETNPDMLKAYGLRTTQYRTLTIQNVTPSCWSAVRTALKSKTMVSVV